MSSKFNVRGKLTITIHTGRNLVVKQLLGEMDPYAQIKVGKEKFKTPVAKNGHRNPKWEFSFIANLDGDEDALHLKVFNKGNLTDDLMSRTDVDLPNLDLSGSQQWYSVRDPDNFSKDCGEVSLSITFEGNGLPPGSRALTTHEARTRGAASPSAAGAVAPATSPIQPQPYQSMSPTQQYATPPPQYNSQAPVYQQPPVQQPVYQQQPVMQQQPMQPVYQAPPMQPVYQSQPQVVYQQSMQPMQPMMQQQPQYTPLQPQYTPAPQPMGLMGGITQLANNIQSSVQNAMHQMSGMPQYRGKFDAQGYLALHPDVAAHGMDAWTHYRNHGFREGRVIQLTTGVRGRFDANGYHSIHVDVKNHGMDAFTHYQNHGHNEGRDLMVSPTGAVGKWDAEGYYNLHPDVRRAGMDSFVHFQNHGRAEGRRISINRNGQRWTGVFDSMGYHGLHKDVKAAGIEGFQHFAQYGKNEGRDIAITF